MQGVPCKVSAALGRHVNFARDPLHSYFDEPQKKKEIHFFYIYIFFTTILRIIFELSGAELQTTRCKKGYKPTHSAITFNSRRHDVTIIERFDNQWRRLFTHDVA